MCADLDKLRETLPPVIARNKISYYLGGLFSSGYLQNLDSEGKGPRRIKIGKRCGYLREDLIEWLKSRSRMTDDKPPK
jgi:hypothetical protein